MPTSPETELTIHANSSPALGTAAVRRSLRQALVSDVDFEAFCADCFRQVQRVYFGGGMERPQKESLLLQYATGDEILTALERWLNTLSAPASVIQDPDGSQRRPSCRLASAGEFGAALTATMATSPTLPATTAERTLQSVIGPTVKWRRHGAAFIGLGILGLLAGSDAGRSVQQQRAASSRSKEQTRLPDLGGLEQVPEASRPRLIPTQKTVEKQIVGGPKGVKKKPSQREVQKDEWKRRVVID